MNISPWLIYWISRLDTIHELCVMVSILGIIVGGAAFLFGIVEEEETPKKWGKNTLIACIFTSLIALFVPTQKQLAAIYLIPKMANSNSAKNIAEATDNATLLLKNKLTEWIADQMKEEKK
jgi:hypothetical protein